MLWAVGGGGHSNNWSITNCISLILVHQKLWAENETNVAMENDSRPKNVSQFAQHAHHGGWSTQFMHLAVTSTDSPSFTTFYCPKTWALTTLLYGTSHFRKIFIYSTWGDSSVSLSIIKCSECAHLHFCKGGSIADCASCAWLWKPLLSAGCTSTLLPYQEGLENTTITRGSISGREGTFEYSFS